MRDRKLPTEREVAKGLGLERTKPAGPPDEAELRQQTAVTRAGRGGRPPASRFVKEEGRQVTFEGRKPFSRAQPAWLRALAEKKADDDQVVEVALRRLSRAPSKGNLELAQAILNDLGRKEGGGPRLRRALTQKLVDQITEKGG